MAVPKGYVIVNNRVKSILPDRTWDQAKTRINELYQNAGGLQVVYCSTIKDILRLKLTDGIVECFLDAKAASSGFRLNVYNQLNALNHKIVGFKSLAKTFNQPSNYSVGGAGRAYTIKGIFQVPPSMPQLVCITYGVIAIDVAFAQWSGIVVKRKNTTLATIKSAPHVEQMDFGTTLGNLIAHELRHQLGLSKKGLGIDPIHTGTGLGMDSAIFSNPKIRFSDEHAIRSNLTKLRQAENKYIFNRL